VNFLFNLILFNFIYFLFFECWIQEENKMGRRNFKKNETETRPEDLRKMFSEISANCEDF